MNSEVLADLGLSEGELEEVIAAEVGNIFPLGTRFSEALDLSYADENDKKIPVVMGSYGIGPGRVMGVIAELLSDAKGLVWPANIAPFKYYLISLGSEESQKRAEHLYKEMIAAGISVLFDDRDERAGTKFADADMIGIPTRLVVSDKTNNQVEVKLRTSESSELVETDHILKAT
jgi:prolyl-tRNA synthetase